MTASLCAVCEVWLPGVLDDLLPDIREYTTTRQKYKRSAADILANKNICWLCCHIYLIILQPRDQRSHESGALDTKAVPVEVCCSMNRYDDGTSGIAHFQLELSHGFSEVGHALDVYIEGSSEYQEPSLRQASVKSLSISGGQVRYEPPVSSTSTSADCSQEGHEGDHGYSAGRLCHCRTQIVKRWMNMCNESHGRCLKYHSSPDLFPKPPTRLIEIGEQPDECKLIETASEPKPRRIVYATLSHCWGRDPIATLTQGNYDEFRLRIPVRKLAKTFRETLQVCRALGIKYLWIDCLCIIQDSEGGADWYNQAPQMQRVYGGSFLSLTASASNKASQGLIRPRLEAVTQPFRVQIRKRTVVSFGALSARHLHTTIFTGSPLCSRGWVMQEFFLSPRKLHFTESQLIWQCNEQVWTERLDIGTGEVPRIEYMYSNTLDTISSSEALDDLWTRLLVDFCQTELTVPGDVLFALSGIAAAFAKRYEELGVRTRYIAGCWEHDLLRYLGWYRVWTNSESRKTLLPKHPFLPAWSCIRSLPAPIAMSPAPVSRPPGFSTSNLPHMEVTHVYIRLGPSQMFGFPESLAVQVCAVIFEIIREESSSILGDTTAYRLQTPTDCHVDDVSASSPSSIMIHENQEYDHVGLDMDEEVDLATGKTLTCAIFDGFGFGSDGFSHGCLLLDPLMTGEGGDAARQRYRRVGRLGLACLENTSDDCGTLRAFFQATKFPRRVLTLV